jgi:predicted secreted protein
MTNASVQPSPSSFPTQTATETVTVQQNLTVAHVVGPCSATLVPGQNMTINETQDNAEICAKPGSSLTIELTDASQTGFRWIINASPGLQITNEGLTYYWYYMNGTFLTTSDAPGRMPVMDNPPDMNQVYGQGIDRWNVTMTQTGIQTINGNLQWYISPELRTLKTFNWTIVVS